MVVRVIGFRDLNKVKKNMIINTTSKSEDWGKAFSPFYLGPVKLYSSYQAKNVENAWQFSKVYLEHVDEKKEPTKEYFEWAQNGWKDSYAHRYPMGKGRIPLYSYWDGQKLDYFQARKMIYAPLYSQAVLKTEAFQKLLKLYESKEDFALLDFDGYDYLSMGMTLKEVVNGQKKMGHAFVLAMLLEYLELRKKYGK